MKNLSLLVYLIIFYSLAGCERAANLTPKVSHFVESEHLKKLDGSEEVSRELRDYIRKEQSFKRTVASSSNLNKAFAPENNPKFPLSYFLIPVENISDFLLPETKDARVLDELSLKISGKAHFKFFIHPTHEKEFDYLRRNYDFIGPDNTEFLATPTSDYYTLVVWNRNNPKRMPFITKLEEKSDDGKPGKQIIRDLTIDSK